MDKLTMSVEEMGAELGISRPTAYALVKRADFPAVRIGRRIVVSREGLREWVTSKANSREAV